MIPTLLLQNYTTVLPLEVSQLLLSKFQEEAVKKIQLTKNWSEPTRFKVVEDNFQ